MNINRVKRKKNSKETEYPSLSSSTEQDLIAIMEKNQLKDMIQDQIISYAAEKKLDQKSFQELTEIVNEFLSCFIVLGYNYTGEPVSLVSCSSQQQADSLGTMLQRFIAQSPGGPGSIAPPDLEV